MTSQTNAPFRKMAKRLNHKIESLVDRISISHWVDAAHKKHREPWWLERALLHVHAKRWILSYIFYVLWLMIAYDISMIVFYILIAARITDANFGIAGIAFIAIGYAIQFAYMAPYTVVSLVYKLCDRAVLRNVRDIARVHFSLPVLHLVITVAQILNMSKYGIVQDVTDDGSVSVRSDMFTSIIIVYYAIVAALITYYGSIDFVRTRDRVAVVKYIHRNASKHTIVDPESATVFSHIQEPKLQMP